MNLLIVTIMNFFLPAIQDRLLTSNMDSMGADGLQRFFRSFVSSWQDLFRVDVGLPDLPVSIECDLVVSG